MSMSRNKKILLMLAKRGGVRQSDVSAAVHVSKRDVSTAAKVVRERGLTFDAISSMDTDAISGLLTPKGARESNNTCLHPDIAGLVEREKRCRKLPVKLFWIECCKRVEMEGKMAYAYQTFCSMFAQVAEKMGTIGISSTNPGPSAT